MKRRTLPTLSTSDIAKPNRKRRKINILTASASSSKSHSASSLPSSSLPSTTAPSVTQKRNHAFPLLHLPELNQQSTSVSTSVKPCYSKQP